MTLNYSMQLIIVLGVVGVSALYMLGKIVPRWRASAAQHLQAPHYPAWINAWGARLSGSAECGSCDSCGSCAPKKPKNVEHS